MRSSIRVAFLFLVLCVGLALPVGGCKDESSSLPPINEIYTACATRALCSSGSLDPWAIDECVDDVENYAFLGVNLADQIACYAAATTCGQASTCASCTPFEVCEGAAIKFCAMGKVATQACEGGSTCALAWDDYPVCSFGLCTGDQGYCEGTVANSCDGSQLRRYDCQDTPVSSATCVVATTEDYSGAICASAPLRPCDGDVFQEYCNGDLAVSCNGGFVLEVDCGAFPIPRQCAIGEEGEAFCIPVSAGARCEAGTDRCLGDSLLTCVEGLLHQVNCGQFGARCEISYGEGYCLDE